MNERKQGRVIPFWFWNDQRLDKDKIRHQIGEIAQKGITEVIIHPRLGLGDYLNQEWFHHIGYALHQAGQLRMRVWLADDKNWPSGTAGGQVIRQEQFRAKAVKPDRAGRPKIQNSNFHPPYSFGSYVDVLSKEATDAFIKSTHQAYYDRFPEYFASGVIAGFYCDEPGMYTNLFGVVDRGAVPYTAELPAVYQRRYGVALNDDFQHIWGGQDWVNRTARLRYFQTLRFLYINSFLEGLHDWCAAHNVLLIGHLLGEEDPLTAVKSQADPFSALATFDWAGYDLIGGFSPPRDIMGAKFARSVANLYDKPEVMAETFGSFGWGLTVELMREVNRWQIKNGATVLVPHALFSSIEGKRKYDAPPSFMQPPYWDQFGQIAQEFKDGVSRNRHHPKLAVYYPVTAISTAYNPINEREARRISNALQNVCGQLELARISLGVDLQFDLLNNGGILKSLPDYNCLYLPRATVIPTGVIKEIARFSRDGGEVIFYDGLPQYPLVEDKQAEFNRYMGTIMDGKVQCLEGRRVPRFSVESALSSSETQGGKYLLWHTLTAISPTLIERLEAIVGKIKSYF